MVKSNISALKNLLELKKVSVQRISYKTLSKLFLLFMLILLVQIKLHPRSRSLIIQTIQILLCVVSVGGAFGMGGLIIYKNHITNEERKEFIKRIKQN
jgi:glucan phosphoethanolaminetransferase (alkaline phosphatase superfamily)